MRRVVLTLILCVSSVSLSAASELSVFYTASFGTSRSMSPSRAEGGPARNAAFDFDVVIALSELDGDGAVLYRDRGKH